MTDDGFLPERQCQIIGQMMRAQKTLPDDFWAIGIVQELAGFLERNEGRLSDDDCALIVGVGAYVAVRGKQEMRAEIEAKMVLGRIASKGITPNDR